MNTLTCMLWVQLFLVYDGSKVGLTIPIPIPIPFLVQTGMWKWK